MPTSYSDIIATSIWRSTYARKKKGMYEADVRYASGEIARPGSNTVKKFPKSETVSSVIYHDDGTFDLVERDED